jgi:hypothetical protein
MFRQFPLGCFLRGYGRALVAPTYRPTALRVALVVGSLLLMINHGQALMRGQMTCDRWWAALLTYVVPYAVNVHGQYSARRSQRRSP